MCCFTPALRTLIPGTFGLCTRQGLPQWVLVMIIVLSVLLVLAAAILTVAFVACSKYRRKRDATKV